MDVETPIFSRFNGLPIYPKILFVICLYSNAKMYNARSMIDLKTKKLTLMEDIINKAGKFMGRTLSGKMSGKSDENLEGVTKFFPDAILSPDQNL